MKLIDIVYLLAFILFIGQGFAFMFGKVDVTVFTASLDSFLVAVWVAIAYMNKSNNKSL